MNELMLILGMSYNVDECYIKCTNNISRYLILDKHIIQQQLHGYQHQDDIIWEYETEFSKQIKAYQAKHNYYSPGPGLQGMLQTQQSSWATSTQQLNSQIGQQNTLGGVTLHPPYIVQQNQTVSGSLFGSFQGTPYSGQILVDNSFIENLPPILKEGPPKSLLKTIKNWLK